MTNKRTEQVRELLNNPRSGLKDSSDTNKTRMEILAIVSELEDELEVNKRTDEEIIEDARTYTRITIVDHRMNGEGRVYDMRDDDMEVSFSEQDDGKTLKVFITTKTI